MFIFSQHLACPQFFACSYFTVFFLGLCSGLSKDPGVAGASAGYDYVPKVSFDLNF